MAPALDGPSEPFQIAPETGASTDKAPKRLAVIGWDGAAWRVLTPLLREGRMPNLARLLRRASYGTLATDVAYSPVSWTTIATGRNASAHGIEGESERWFAAGRTAASVRAAQLWDMLPEGAFPRVMTLGWFFPPNWRALGPKFAGRNVEPGPIETAMKGCPGPTAADDEISGPTNCLLAGIEWDAAFALYRVSDAAGHRDFSLFRAVEGVAAGGWRFAPGAAPKARAIARQSVAAFELLDAALAPFAEDEQTLIAIVSDHGFRSAAPIGERLMLSERFYGTWGQDPPARGETMSFDVHTDAGAARIAVEPVVHRRPVVIERESGWTLRQVLEVPTIRCAGRDGCPPECLDFLRAATSTVSVGGEPLYGESQPDGRAVTFQPTLQALAQWFERERPALANSATPAGAGAPWFTFVAEAGRHRYPHETGVIVLAGPGVVRGQIISAKLTDVAPTLLALAGLPVAADFDGRVLREAISPAFLEAHPIRTIASYGVGHELADESAQALSTETVQRLKSLGYVSPHGGQ
jgi:hypothetical protein